MSYLAVETMGNTPISECTTKQPSRTLNKMNEQKILVIGSNSFSGSHFVAEALRAGHCVWGVSRSPEPSIEFLPYRWAQANESVALATAENFKFQAIDINSQLNELIELIDQVKPEIVVNFAAQGMVAESWLNPTHWYQTNVVSQVALHEALRQKKFLEKYVHVTTPEVYGQMKVMENNRFSPSTPYAVSHAACDKPTKSRGLWVSGCIYESGHVYDQTATYRIIPRTMLSGHWNTNASRRGSFYSMLHTYQRCRTSNPGSSKERGTWDNVAPIYAKSLSIRELVEQICNLAV